MPKRDLKALHSPTSRRLILIAASAAAVIILFAAALFFHRYLSDPQRPFLAGEAGAAWIRYDRDSDLLAKQIRDKAIGFRTRFSLPEGLESAVLTFKAMKAADVYIDDSLVFTSGPERKRWKQPRGIDLGGLPAGDHELKLVVTNDNGPPCLLAYCPPLRIFTGQSWQASTDAKNWATAAAVDAYRPAPLSRKFPRADVALLRSLPLLLAVFAFAALWTLALHSQWPVSPLVRRLTPRASTWRGLLMGAVGLMAMNNIFKLPFYYGFDFQGQIEYIQHVARQWRIPLPTEGWTMFQAPLYYLLSAPLYHAATALFDQERALQTLRLLTLPCAVLQVDLAYRAARYVFPGRDGLQMAATTVGGLLPASLYMSQYVGNEPLAGVLAGLVVVLALRFYYQPQQGRKPLALALIGLALGLAALAKLTALFLVPPLAALMACAYLKTPGKHAVRRAAVAFLLVFGAAALVAGWYYARNYIVLGRAFWGGWEAERGIPWWQEPGYRTLHQLIPAGEALLYPVCSSLVSFWDGFYSTLWADGYIASTTDPQYLPPWNYNLMLGGVLLSLIPTAAIFAGAAAAFRNRPERTALIFLAATLALYVAMMIYGFLALPYYCITKGTYTLALACGYGALAAAGFSLIPRSKWANAALAGILAAWAAAAYGAYFIF